MIYLFLSFDIYLTVPIDYTIILINTNLYGTNSAIAGPMLGGYLYGNIGFFWLCIVLACFLLVSAPFTFIYLGDEITPISKYISKPFYYCSFLCTSKQ